MASESVVTAVEDAEHLASVKEAHTKAGKRFVVEFSASWCKVCKRIKPAVEKLAARHAQTFSFYTVDAGELEDLAMDYDVTSVPRFFFFDEEGNQTGDYLGSLEKDLRARFLEHAIAGGEAPPDPLAARRALHWVLKIGNLRDSMAFFEQVLGLQVLRHEEFDSGCEATCNGPYGGAWSKTMIGYGPESDNFALELTYNYGIDGYEFGNDLQYIALAREDAIQKARDLGMSVDEATHTISGPDNYKYKIIPPVAGRAEQFAVVGLRVADLERARDYYVNLLGLQEMETVPGTETGDTPSVTVGFAQEQTFLQLIEVADGAAVDHAKSSGRIAFACHSVQPIFEAVTKAGDTVQTPPLTLPTPGKADVVVTILVDRDGYEICFVEDEAFYELATPTYDVINYEERATRGGDGHPPPTVEGPETSVPVLEDDAAFARALKKAAKAGELVVVEFGASWCRNCRRIAPFLETLSKDTRLQGKASFYSVDIDDCEDLALEYEVSSVPHFVFLRNGDKVADYIGSSETELEEIVSTKVAEISSKRSLHWVLKIGNLRDSMAFFENILGLRVLRHEEFDSGCEATCNGPYGGAWSKTMIGYGPESSNFALELTYNYGIDGYEFGNDLQYIALANPPALRRAKALGAEVDEATNTISGPDNYKYKIIPPVAGRAEQFAVVGLRVADLERARDYYVNLLGLQEMETVPGTETGDTPSVTVGFAQEQTFLQLIEVADGAAVDHAKSSGRIAFACHSVQPIFEAVTKAGDTVQTPPLTLPTPGKADVVVTILVDRDGYEICFVEDVAFYQLAEPVYDVVDYEERATRGGDGNPPPKA